jgi:hypothetical protein
MSDKAIRDIAVGLFVTVVGGVLVAWIIQEGKRFEPASLNSTPTPIIITATPGYPHISIENRLVLPVKIYINDTYANTIAEGETATFLITSSPSKVQFDVVNFGKSWDYMSGIFEKVYDGQVIAITNVIGGEFYFFVRISNNSSRECEIIIDNGYVTEKRPGVLKPFAQNVSMGYYHLYSNSNVTLNCNDGQSFFWGIQPGQTQPPPQSITYIVQPESGLLEITLNP